MLSPSDVHNYLEERGVAHEMLPLEEEATTAELAAELLGVAVADVVKSLLFLADGAPVLVLAAGDARVGTEKLARVLGATRVTLARAPDVLAQTGYRVGAVPPCGLANALPVVADPGAFAPPVVYCGGGATATMVKIRSADLRALLDPVVADIAER